MSDPFPEYAHKKATVAHELLNEYLIYNTKSTSENNPRP